MPFCTQCGHEASSTDAFCGRCGARQPGAPAGGFRTATSYTPQPMQDPLAGLSPRTAAILCYVPAIGWIAAIIVLATRRFKEDRLVRFHAFQGLYLFAAWLIVDWGVGPIVRWTPGRHVPLDTMLHGLILAVSIFMMIKASHDEAYVLPIIGELAQRSATEQ
jgi:uncharacterized membrane protein